MDLARGKGPADRRLSLPCEAGTAILASMKRLAPIAFTVLIAAATPHAAMAWGGLGHRLIGLAAARALPPEIPAFLRSKQAIEDQGELALEPDHSKGSGKEHDLEMQSAHFIDIDENGKVLGGPPSDNLPPTREMYEKLLVPFSLNSWQVGYLPYTIFDRWQVLAKDFATYRALVAAQANPKWKAHWPFFAADLRRRQALILEHVGELAHYVGDGSQPLHTSNHFNGWGAYPNPNGYTQARIHASFEGEFVAHNLTLPLVEAQMTPLSVCSCAIEGDAVRYLNLGATKVVPLYQLEKEGALKDGDPRMIAFTADRLAAGASKTRDLIVGAWRASIDFSVGYKPVKVTDILSGKTDPYDALMNKGD